MFRIRFHGRGGQGMKTASRILGSALFRAGYEVQDAPRYGAERSGAPIFAYVRADRRPILERGIIRNPDLVAVADDTLVAMPAAGVLQGLGPDTALLVVSAESAAEWRRRLNLAGPILVLPPEVAAPGERHALGVACAGAAAALLRVVPRPALEEAVGDEVGALGAAALAASREATLAAYDRFAGVGAVREGREARAVGYHPPDWIDLPLDRVDAAAPAIHAARTSELSPTGLWRTLRPVLDPAHCKHCWWVCASFCPDGAIAVDGDGLPQFDYDHCKGCLVCVHQCPAHAIAAVAEREHP